MPFVDLDPTPLGAVTDRPKDFVVTPGAADVELGSDAPDFKSTLGAAFRQDNIIGSFMARKDANLPMDKEDGFDAWAKIKGTPLEQNWDSFTDVHNQRAFDMRLAQIKQEEDDRRTLATAPWYKSIPAQLTAGVFDPVNFLPAGYVIRTAKGGISIAKTAAASGLLTGASSAAQEAVLQNTQQTRTAEESAMGIGTSVLLGALLGAGGAKLFDHLEWRKAQEDFDRHLAGEPPPPPPPGEAVAPYENDFLRDFFAQQNAVLDKAEADLSGLKADIAAREVQAGVTGEVSAMPPAETFADVASREGLTPGSEEYDTRFNAWSAEQASARQASEKARRIEEGQASADKVNGWRNSVVDWMKSAEDGAAIEGDIEGERYVLRVSRRKTGEEVRSLVLDHEGAMPVVTLRDGKPVGKIEATIDPNHGGREADSAGALDSIGKGLEDGTHKVAPTPPRINGEPLRTNPSQPQARFAPQGALGTQSVTARMSAPQIEKDLGFSVPGTLVKGSFNPAGKLDGMFAWHGSPHDFEKFDLGKIGSGEGAQGEGHGLYFAQKKNVAEKYAEENVSVQQYWHGLEYLEKRGVDEHYETAIFWLGKADGDADKAIELVKNSAKESKEKTSVLSGIVDSIKVLAELKPTLYQTRLNVSLDKMIDLDKPFSQQPQYVLDAFRRLGWPLPPYDRAVPPDVNMRVLWKLIVNNTGMTPEKAAAELRKEGVDGVQYFDALSRDERAGTKNFVIFDDSKINIVGKNGEMTPLRGQATGQLTETSTAAINAALDASKKIRAAEETGNLASIPEASAATKAEPTVEGGPVGVFMFDPTTLKVDAKRFQFKEGGNEQGVTTALKGVTKWDRAKGNQVIVWQDKGGDLYIVDGHQRSGLARRLIESGKEKSIELPGLLYREADGVSAEDVRAIAAVKNIAEGSGSSLDGAKVLRSRPDLMDGSLPLSAGKGRQAAALSRLDDEAFRMVVNDVVPENYGAIVGERIPDDGPRQIAAIKAIAKFKPENETQAAVLVQRVSDAELAKAEEGAQGSMFGDLESADSTAGEEMKIVGRAIKELQKDKALFQRVVANANRIEETGSNIERQSAKEVTTEAEMFARRLASDAYSPGPLRDELKAAAKDLQSEKIQIGEAVARIRAALGRAAEDDGNARLGNRARGEQAASTGATSGQSISEPAPLEALFDDIRPAGARERDATPAPAVEPGAEGKPQILIEGVKPVTDQDRAAAGIARPLRGGNAPAGGMFDEANTAQPDIFSSAPEAPDLGGQTNYNAKPGSVSAASVTPANLEDNSVAGKAAAFVAYNSMFPTKAGFTQFNPLLRALASPSAVVRDIMLKLVENPIYLKKNMEGVASEASAETLMKQWDAGLTRAVETTTKAFSDYRKGGGRMTYIEFREAVGKAMRRGDTSAEPAVEKVAKDWRKNVFDPLKDAAINAGLLPEDVTVDTAVSYFSRMWNRQRLIAQEPQFKQIVRNWVDASFPRWQAGFDRETTLKSAKLSGDKLRAYQAERIRERERLFGIEPGEVADTVADEVFDTLVGRTDGGARPELVTIKARGPLAERTFSIPDELVEDFLVHDILGVGARYSRIMRADVEIANKFGAPDMKEQINAINAQYKELSALAENEAQRTALDVARRNDIADVEAMRDIMRGVGYKLPHVWEKNFDHISRLARHYNYIRSMGEASLASLAESVRPAMVHGLMPYMETIGNLAFNLKAVKLSIEEAKRAGNISERVLGHRIAGLMEISDPYASKGATEAMLENLTSVASVWNGIRLLTDWQKSVAAVMTQDRILKGAKSYASIPQSEKAYLAYLGINERMAEKIFQQFDTHGLIVDGVRVAKTENWTDDAARRAYYAAINKDIDSIITTRGVADVPLFANSPVGAVMLQFRTFALAAHQRVLLRGLQEDQTRFLGGIIAMTTIGMMTTWLKAISANREEKLADFSKKPGWWISEGLDRAGILAGTMEVANAFEKVTDFNPIKAPIQAFDEGGRRESQRIQNTNAWGAIAGPTIGLGNDIVTTLGIPSAVKKGNRVSKAQKNAAERLVPFSSYPFVRQVMRYVINPQ